LLEFDFENSVGYWICTTSHALRMALQSSLQDSCNLSIRQWEVLACLACDEGMTQAEMADRLGIEPGTFTGIVSRMEVAGWLERRTCSEDRRKNRIYPTEKAEQIWKQTTEICHEVRQRATAGIDAKTLESLKTVCEQIRQNLERTGTPGAAAPCLDKPGDCGRRAAGAIAVKSEAVIT
jgi:DNA-binding MarR family transcriptional regulator